MKTSKFKSLILVILTIFAFNSGMALDEFKKVEHFNWTPDKVSSLSITNKFGNINFSNEVVDSVIVIATITVNESSEKKGNHLLEQINISKRQSGRDIYIKTEIDNGFKSRQEFSIHYQIIIPANKKLDITNKFGNIYLKNLMAEGSFKVEYGNIAGDTISTEQKPAEIEIAYGEGVFKAVNKINAEVSYGKLQIAENELGTINSSFSVVKIDRSENLEIQSKYDTYSIEEIESLAMEAQFTKTKIEKINNSLVLDNKYGGGFKVEELNSTFNNVYITNNYSNISIGISDEAAYNLEAELKYCKIYHPTGEIIQSEKSNNSLKLKAIIGDSPVKSKVVIESSYGNIDLKE